MKLEIFDMDHNGKGISKNNNKVIFIPKTIPGDVCEVSVVKNCKNYDLGKLDKIIVSSKDRKEALCPYYYICGGCNISNLSYDKQLEYKVKKVKNIFKKYLNYEINPVVLESKKEYKYRNKITYHNDRCLGLIAEFGDIVDIDNCMLVSDNINNLFNKIKALDTSMVKMITIKECDNGLILSITGNLDTKELENSCLAIYMNGKCTYRKDDGYIYLNNIKYMVSNESFFQINTSNIKTLYDEIVRMGKFNKDDEVIDLYCGVGSISLYIAKYVKKVLGIEIVDKAITDAKKNAEINGVSNVEFLCCDVSKVISDVIFGNKIIVDPPRIGLDKRTTNIINESKISEIIYVSCNPMTLVRDIKLLNNYVINDVSVIDMFPQTHHCEVIVILNRK